MSTLIFSSGGIINDSSMIKKNTSLMSIRYSSFYNTSSLMFIVVNSWSSSSASLNGSSSLISTSFSLLKVIVTSNGSCSHELSYVLSTYIIWVICYHCKRILYILATSLCIIKALLPALLCILKTLLHADHTLLGYFHWDCKLFFYGLQW